MKFGTLYSCSSTVRLTVHWKAFPQRLHEFKADNIHNIVNHSEARLLFVGDQVWENLNEDAMPQLLGVILMTEFTPVVCRDKRLMEAFETCVQWYGICNDIGRCE